MAKVTVNDYDIIVLDGNMNSKRHRLTTGKKNNDRLLLWYKNNFDDEFEKLYNKKFNVVQDDFITFRDYGLLVLDITKNNRNSFSQKEELQRFKTLCLTFGDMGLSNIKASHIVKWQNESMFAAKTIINYRGTLNIVLNMAYCDDLINKNPLTMVKAPKRKKKQVEIFSEDEVRLLISESFGQFKNILQFTFFQGLRGSELIALRWSNIDLDNNKVTIDTRIRDGNEDVTKSKTIRVIDLLPHAKDALLMQRRLTGLQNDFVFVTQYGKPYNRPSKLTDKLKELCISLDIKPRTMHVVRKTCNTIYKKYNMHNDWILHQLGHIDSEVNINHYTGIFEVDLSKVGTLLA